MLFPTIDFAIFFAVVYTVQWLLNPYAGPWKAFMVLASYFFYAWWDWHFIFLLAASTGVAFLGGRLVHRTSGLRHRVTLWTTLALLIGLLAWFKYYGFVALNLDNFLHAFGLGRPLPLVAVTLPVGISFFTFMAISYVVDIHRGVLKPARGIDVTVYLSFFPHLVAGPIVRGTELLPQIRRRRDPDNVRYVEACWLIAAGLVKKVVLSSYLSTYVVDPVFADPHQHSALEVLFAIYGYAVQIYADFSGYTDIAIGIALLLGFRFPVNFRRPYTAVSLQDFWRRWHITLSFWLRDYLYIPLGGNRGSEWRISVNILVTMLIGGLWHGAAWTFVLWGAFQGAGLVAEHALGGRIRAPLWLRWFVTFHLIVLGWILFRSETIYLAGVFISRLFTAGAPTLWTAPVVGAIVLVIGMQLLPEKPLERFQVGIERMRPALLAAGLAIVIVFASATVPTQGVPPFIYFRF